MSMSHVHHSQSTTLVIVKFACEKKCVHNIIAARALTSLTEDGKEIFSDMEVITCCCEILMYSQVYEPYWNIVWQELGRTHRDLNEHRKIKSNLNQINPNPV